jgi:polyphosphate kinase 2 (PPK2 family)
MKKNCSVYRDLAPKEKLQESCRKAAQRTKSRPTDKKPSNGQKAAQRTKQNNQGKGKMGASAASSSLKDECFQLAPEGRVLAHEEARLDSLLQAEGAHGVEGELQLREDALHPRAWRLHERHQPQRIFHRLATFPGACQLAPSF